MGSGVKVRLNPDGENGKMVVKFCGRSRLTEWGNTENADETDFHG
jgi:hypothetical protein